MTPEELDEMLAQPFDSAQGGPAEPSPAPSQHQVPRLAIAGAVALVALMLIGGFNLLYVGKVMPGVRVNGVYLGGLSRDQALAAVRAETDKFATAVVPINYGDTTSHLDIKNLGLQYENDQAVDLALQFGRQGDLPTLLRHQARAMLGRTTNVASYDYQPAKLTPYLSHMAETVTQPVSNAGFSFEGATAIAHEGSAGRRLDVGWLTHLINHAIATASDQPLTAPIYTVAPTITAADLAPLRQTIATYSGGPLEVKAASRNVVVEPEQIVTWLSIFRPHAASFAQTGRIEDFYPLAREAEVRVDGEKVAAFVADLAKRTDQTPQDAQLTIDGERASVFRPSRDGYELNQTKAIEQITKGLAAEAEGRKLTLEVKVTQPLVREDNLNNLGIKELISEGVSSFPGSPAARIQNIRVGTRRYHGALIKPGATFSFGALLGEVSAATGYAPAKVILADRQEEQYGGGLCQVSSTIYRAALNAGLPITQRQNHSFAVSYYTNPYGVPGVDATIYYPQVDLKFRNDTGAHILIQAIFTNSSLRFQFYGTKNKEGRIRGPFFVSGGPNPEEPSHTVFYRDIIRDGAVVKTDTVHTYYKSSKEFPSQQYN